MRKQVQMYQMMVAALLLATGLIVRLLDRPADPIHFISDWWRFTKGAYYVFGPISADLPTFVHILVITLIVSALLAPRYFPITFICLLWLGKDSLLDLAQHDAIAIRIANISPGWPQDIIILTDTFDLLDLISVALVSGVAYLMAYYFQNQEYDNVTKQ